MHLFLKIELTLDTILNYCNFIFTSYFALFQEPSPVDVIGTAVLFCKNKNI